MDPKQHMEEWLDKIIKLDLLPDFPLLERTIEQRIANTPGLIMEFGVYKGYSIRRIACAVNAVAPNRIVYGFDSFEGIPEDWNNMPAGTFATEMPWVPDNVILIKGWFEDVLDDFLKRTKEPIALLHIDCDLYSSTDFILRKLEDRFTSGTLLAFDELAYYPEYKEGEYKAFVEMIVRTNYPFKFVGRTNTNGMLFRFIDEGET